MGGSRAKKQTMEQKKQIDFKIASITGAGILAAIMLMVFIMQGCQNKAFALEEQINTAESDIKVQEKRRVKLIGNLVDCVKQYDRHEGETLEAVAESRGTDGTENVTESLMAVAEAYPELQSSGNYKELMNELSITENLLAGYRSNYNAQVKEYRRYVRKFPARQFLSMMGYRAKEYQYLDYDIPEEDTENIFGEE